MKYSKAIWIPTEGGDLRLNMLFRSLEKTLKSNNFKVYNTIITDEPCNSNINIICSHGDKDIAKNQLLHPNREISISNKRTIISTGDVLIFFVCHSGSYAKGFLNNDMSSLVKTYIKKGYKAVIAPFWALHIDLPKIWLPEFLISLNNGCNIDKAVFKANQVVRANYPTIAAWGSMHLYGCPTLSVNNSKSI